MLSRSLVIQRAQPSPSLSLFAQSYTCLALTRQTLTSTVSCDRKSETSMSQAIRCVDRHHIITRLTIPSSPLSWTLTLPILNRMQSNRKEHKHKHRDLVKELEEGIGIWNGPSIFASTSSTLDQHKQQGLSLQNKTKKEVRARPLRTSPELISTPIKSGSGDIHSPISISSSSPSPSPSSSPLSRPRAIPQFSSPLPRTAFTPLRATTSQTQTQTRAKPLHPFFVRSRTAPPPTNRPRLVAHYSSTSVTTTTATTSSQSQSQSQSQSRSNSQESKAEGKTKSKANTDKWEAEMTFIADQIEAIDFGRSNGKSQNHVKRQPLIQPKRLPVNSAISSKGKVNGKNINTKSLPIFQHTSYSPPPQIVYTSSTTEANDLLSCLKGDVLGFDMEWPPAGRYKVEQPDGTFKEKRVGMKYNDTTKRWAYGQGRTALIQFCDEKLVVLVHLGENMELPSKAVEIINDPTIYKLGVQVRGDGLKLLRDFPHLFIRDTETSSGPSGLLELSHLARMVDPIGTGPGSTLIKLSTLCSEYLGKELEKPVDVRQGNWFGALGPRERNYAANDVYSSLKIFRHLEHLAKEKNLTLNLDKFCSNLSPSSTSDILNSTSRTGSGLSNSNMKSTSYYSPDSVYVGKRIIPLSPGTKAPTPAQINALAGFMDGVGVSDLAEIKGVKRTTIEGYILNAIQILGMNILNEAEKERLSIEIPSNSSTWIRHKSLQSVLASPEADTLPVASAYANKKEKGKKLVELSSSPIASENESEGSEVEKNKYEIDFEVLEDTEIDAGSETDEEIETIEQR